MESLAIRDSEPEDISELESLYPDAFPEEDLLPLVKELLQSHGGVLSLVAILNGSLAGHVIFTLCGVTESEEKVGLLGPLAVASDRQRQGIGSALVGAGLQRLQRAGAHLVCVLGDPAYYGRFGFTPEAHLAPPYPLPPEWRDAWQSVGLGRAAAPGPGKLAVPASWRRPALWAP